MAIVAMQKVAVLAHESLKEDLLTSLYNEGVLEVTEAKEPIPIDHTEVNFRSAEVSFAVNTLKDSASKETQASLNKKATVEEIIHAAQHTDVLGIVNMLHKLEEEDTNAQKTINELRERRKVLAPWKNLPYELDAETETKTSVRLLSTDLSCSKLPYFRD